MIALIAAMAKHRVMGFEGDMPWHLPADLKHFKTTTLGKPIIMGRKTYESLGRPLPGRENIVITRQSDFTADGVTVFHDVDTALDDACERYNDVMIIGGATIYQQTLDRVDTMYLTYIDLEVDGDTYFPTWSLQDWCCIDDEAHQPDDNNPYAYRFLTFQRHG